MHSNGIGENAERKDGMSHIPRQNLTGRSGVVGCPGVLDLGNLAVHQEEELLLVAKKATMLPAPHSSQLVTTAIAKASDPPPMNCACPRERNHAGTCWKSSDTSAAGRRSANLNIIVPK
jgi:hypothetical protein